MGILFAATATVLQAFGKIKISTEALYLLWLLAFIQEELADIRRAIKKTKD